MSKLSTNGTQSIGRAAAILRVVAAGNEAGFGLAEIAKQTGIERPTTHRILRRLVDEAMLIQNPTSRSYHLGPLLHELGLAATPSMPARELCSAALKELSHISGDCTFLMIRSSYDSVCLERQEGHFPIKTLVLGVGQRRPLGCGAGSIALMSAMPDEQVRNILDHNQPLLAARGEPDTEEFLTLIRQARDAGYAIKDAPDLPVRSLSMAVQDRYGKGLCALTVTTLTNRIEQRRAMLVDTLRNITGNLAIHIQRAFGKDMFSTLNVS